MFKIQESQKSVPFCPPPINFLIIIFHLLMTSLGIDKGSISVQGRGTVNVGEIEISLLV